MSLVLNANNLGITEMSPKLMLVKKLSNKKKVLMATWDDSESLEDDLEEEMRTWN